MMVLYLVSGYRLENRRRNDTPCVGWSSMVRLPPSSSRRCLANAKPTPGSRSSTFGACCHTNAFLMASVPSVLRILLRLDRKSTRLNSSHQIISYAVFCLKKKKTKNKTEPRPTLASTHVEYS